MNFEYMLSSLRERYRKILFVSFSLCVLIMTLLANYAYADYFAWTPQTNSPGTQGWYSVAVSDNGAKVFAVKSDYDQYIYVSTDSGVTWSSNVVMGGNTYRWKGITSDSTGTYLAAVAENEYIFTSSDGGTVWTERSSSVQQEWTSIASDSTGAYLTAVAYGGTMYRSNNQGVTWGPVPNPGVANWVDVASSNDGNSLVAAVAGGYLYTSIDAGASWGPATNGGSRAWRSVDISADGQIIVAAAESDYLYRSEDAGITWSALTEAPSTVWTSVSISDNGEVIAASVHQSNVYTSTDGGETWEIESGSATGLVKSVALLPDGSALVLASSDTYIYTAVDNTLPTVQNVTSSSSNGSYKAGDVINITVEFSEPVTSTGNVTVTLETGTTDRTCTFTVSNGTTGTCDYTVQSGDISSDLTVNSISGTLTDQAGNSMTNFVPVTNLAANKALVIDAVIRSSGGFSSTQSINADGSVTTSTGNVTVSVPSVFNFNTNIATTTKISTSTSQTTQYVIPSVLNVSKNASNNSNKVVYSTGVISPINLSSNKQAFITPNGTVFTFNKNLGTLSPQNTDIKKLQVFLNSVGFPVATQGLGSIGNETNKFGPATKQALLKFQKAAGIKGANGNFGPATRAYINKLLQSAFGRK